MARTFCNTPLTFPHRHTAKTERGHYVMSAFWIDTAQACDMMDYDMTDSIANLKASHEETRLMNIYLQHLWLEAAQ